MEEKHFNKTPQGRYIHPEDYLELERFNEEHFPIRDRFKDYFEYRFLLNPHRSADYEGIFPIKQGGKIIAQMQTMPGSLQTDNQEISVYWGQDYIVVDAYKGKGIGKELTQYFLAKPYYIAVGFSEKSAVIHKKFGCKTIGYLDFYEKWISPFIKVKFLFQRGLKIKPKSVSEYQFPQKIGDFYLAQNAEELELHHNQWNNEVVEVTRNHSYLHWRFFFKPNRYFVYYKNNKNTNATYFVCKAYFYKGVNWLRIIDYRFSIEDKDQFKKIVNTAEDIAKHLSLFGVLVPSSMDVTKKELEQKNYQRTAHKFTLTNYPFPFAEVEVEESNNRFLITFADSDMDMHTNKGHFVYGENY